MSPSLPTLKKMQASIDACVGRTEILRKYKDPHLYSSLIKHYLRQLPDPLLCSHLISDWRSLEIIKNEVDKRNGIKELLEKVPKANKNNIAFLIGFLSKLVTEEKHNKMSIENIILLDKASCKATAPGHLHGGWEPADQRIQQPCPGPLQ